MENLTTPNQNQNTIQNSTPPAAIPLIQPVMPTPAKSNNPLLTVIIVVILLISLGTTGFFAYQNQQLKQQISHVQPTPTSSATPSPMITSTPDPTANWKTYNYSKMISLKLPQEMASPSFVNNGYYAVETTLPSGTLLQIYGGDGTATPTGGPILYQSLKSILTKDPTFTTSVINIFGNEAVHFSSKTTQSTNVWGGESYDKIDGLIINLNGNALIVEQYDPITKLGGANTNFDSDNVIFNHILSTFTFTNQTSNINGLSNSYTISIPSSWSGKYKLTSITSQNAECNEYDFIGTSINEQLFSICRMTLSIWAANQNINVSAQRVPPADKLGEDNTYVYFKEISLSNEYSGTEAANYQGMAGDIPTILSSFKLTSQ